MKSTQHLNMYLEIDSMWRHTVTSSRNISFNAVAVHKTSETMVLPVVATAAVPGSSARAQPQAQQSRKMGGGGQPQPQSMQARLWEGHSPEPEGWEPTLYATYVVGFGLITLALGFASDTTIASVSF